MFLPPFPLYPLIREQAIVDLLLSKAKSEERTPFDNQFCTQLSSKSRRSPIIFLINRKG